MGSWQWLQYGTSLKILHLFSGSHVDEHPANNATKVSWNNCPHTSAIALWTEGMLLYWRHYSQTAEVAISVKTLFNNWTKHWTKPLLIIYTSTASLRWGRLTAARKIPAQLQNLHAKDNAPVQALPLQPACDNKRHFIQCLKANWEKGGPKIRIKKKNCVEWWWWGCAWRHRP